jgi:hypothetical protein
MQITVKKLWPMDAGKNNGGFVGVDGNNYKCDAATHRLLAEGMSFDVNTKASEFNGKTYYWLPKGFTPNAAGNSNIVQPHAPSPVPQPPMQQARMTNTACDKDVLITTTALMKSFIESGKYGLTDLEVLETACLTAARSMVKACSQ